jgi:hypothetical protein
MAIRPAPQKFGVADLKYEIFAEKALFKSATPILLWVK